MSGLIHLNIKDPAILEVLNINKESFVRTFKYSYIMTGTKFRAACKLVSGSETNLSKLRESAFDGKTFTTFTSDTRYMTKGSIYSGRVASEGGISPLTAPFIFLEKESYNGRPIGLRFTDVHSLDLTNILELPNGQSSGGLLEISVIGLPAEGKATTWKIGVDEAGASFSPKTVEHFTREGGIEVYRFLNYTNLGAYRFPSRIEWARRSYPPTTPPTLVSTGLATVISARIPERVADSVFRLDEEEQLATTVWDNNEKKFIKVSPEALQMKRYRPAVAARHLWEVMAFQKDGRQKGNEEGTEQADDDEPPLRDCAPCRTQNPTRRSRSLFTLAGGRMSASCFPAG